MSKASRRNLQWSGPELAVLDIIGFVKRFASYRDEHLVIVKSGFMVGYRTNMAVEDLEDSSGNSQGLHWPVESYISASIGQVQIHT